VLPRFAKNLSACELGSGSSSSKTNIHASDQAMPPPHSNVVGKFVQDEHTSDKGVGVSVEDECSCTHSHLSQDVDKSACELQSSVLFMLDPQNRPCEVFCIRPRRKQVRGMYKDSIEGHGKMDMGVYSR